MGAQDANTCTWYTRIRLFRLCIRAHPWCHILGALVRRRVSLITRAIERQHVELYMNATQQALLAKYSQCLSCMQMCTARRSSRRSIPYCGAFVRFRFYRWVRSRAVLP